MPGKAMVSSLVTTVRMFLSIIQEFVHVVTFTGTWWRGRTLYLFARHGMLMVGNVPVQLKCATVIMSRVVF